MKHISIFFIFFSIVSCSIKSNDPHKEISNYLKTLSLYQPINFGQLTNDSSNYTDDPRYKALEDSIESYKQTEKSLTHSFSVFKAQPAQSMSAVDKTYMALSQENQIEQKYNRRPDGFKMQHIFKYKNKAGLVILDSLTFRFDSSINLRNEDYLKRLNL